MTADGSRKPRGAGGEPGGRPLIDTRRLFHFFHVVRSGSLTAAEAQLDVAQSTLTRQIQQLEAEMGTRLLERTGRGVVPTEAGEILLRHAESILADMSEAVDEIARSRREPAGQLSVAAPQMVSTLFMPEVIRRLVDRFPDLRLTVLEAATGQVHEHLAAGHVDVAVLVIAPKTHRLHLKKVGTEPLRLVVHRSHPLARAEAVAREALAELELIVPAASRGTRTLLEDYFREGGLALDPRLNVDSLVVTKALIEQGSRFCSILPERACAQELRAGSLRAIPLTPALDRSFYVARLRDRPVTPYIRALAAELEDVLKA